jgi:hypothetical protein
MGGSNGREAAPVSLWEKYITNWNRKEYVYLSPIVQPIPSSERAPPSSAIFLQKIASRGEGKNLSP